MAKLITQIKKNKHNTNCQLIVCDTEDAGAEIHIEFSMDLVLEYQLSKNKLISYEEFEMIVCKQRLIDSKRTAYNFATKFPKTKQQVVDKLAASGFHTAEIDCAVSFLENFNLLDDVEYSRKFISTYLLTKKVGKLRIRNELIKRGISKEIADEAISSFFPADKSINLAFSVAEKKLSTVSKKPLEKQKQSVYNHLLSKGFSFEEAKNTINKLFDK